MAAVAEVSDEAVVKVPAVQSSLNTHPANANSDANPISAASDCVAKDSDSDSKLEYQMQDIVNMSKTLKLNPLAKEFFPSSFGYYGHCVHFAVNYFVPSNKSLINDGYPNSRRRTNNFSQVKRQRNGRTLRAQRDDSIRRTVYVSDLDHNITEEQLAALFIAYGQVLDCRVCGDPNSCLCFAFVEFSDEYSAKEALNLCGTMLGFSPIRVLPSKTAILPLNPTFLPKSDDEKEMCARTVYCTNVDKEVSQDDVKNFFETRCGKVSRLRLLGDQVHSTRIAFVEFTVAESAFLALDTCGELLGSERIRVSPSKTPVRPRVPRSAPPCGNKSP